MAPQRHVHMILLDPSLTPEEAWQEYVDYGGRVTHTGRPEMMIKTCDGVECKNFYEVTAAEMDRILERERKKYPV